ncbi:ABC transporter ATP-binding protein [Flavihumibacter sp. ZG627]|uniref:ABC transporter ATP-binding protein n=1 Tax=Flavihumibacter sp. ZG627 TaxID=1463156 RepID=UPI00057D1BDC|nr:ABC transporter ATP-binding protein [Flavihumibacter sp. ZG627]KIC90374.1 ABC transporter ATP-binding protein [Flavihumibacter sp. ZG627]
MPTLLEIKNLSVAFGDGDARKMAVSNISFTVNRGEILAVVGESGSGKSVTALSILQLLSQKTTRYPSGQILFDHNSEQLDLLQVPADTLQKIRGADISMIFQEPMTSLNPVFTCGDQVIEAILQHQDIGRAAAREKAKELFTKVRLPDPEEILKRFPHQLSGGQKQRIMIAMAISCDPALLIADEPTTALDVTVQKNILELLRDLQAQTGMGMIIITHDLGVVKDIAHRVVVMYRGQLVETANTNKLFSSPAHPYTQALLACRPLLHNKGSRLPVVSDFMNNEATIEKPSLTSLIVASSQTRKAESGENPVPLLEVSKLRVWFPSRKNIFGKPLTWVKAVNDVSFEVLHGETLGIVGESGSGKTTLGRALLRLVPANGGEVIYRPAGIDLLSLGKHKLEILRKNIQIVFQDPYASLNPRMRIGDALLEAMSTHGIETTVARRKERVVQLLEKVNLEADHFKRYPHAFSGGQRQRIGIARALALEPGFIVFDESVSALDVSVQAQVLNLINDLKSEFGFTAIFISHDLGVVRYISDRIMVMHAGQTEEIGPAEQVFNNPTSLYTRRLVDAIPGGKNQFL